MITQKRPTCNISRFKKKGSTVILLLLIASCGGTGTICNCVDDEAEERMLDKLACPHYCLRCSFATIFRIPFSGIRDFQ